VGQSYTKISTGIIQGVSERALQLYSKCYCAANVIKRLQLKAYKLSIPQDIIIYKQSLFQSRLGTCSMKSSSGYNGSLATWIVIRLTAAKFKLLLFCVGFCIVQHWETYTPDFLSVFSLSRNVRRRKHRPSCAAITVTDIYGCLRSCYLAMAVLFMLWSNKQWHRRS
jgi:hypothetical protein